MRNRTLSAATREKLRSATLASWRSGKRRDRRTKKQIAADRQRNPWEPIERRLELEGNRERRRDEARGAVIFDLGGTMRRLTAKEALAAAAAVGARPARPVTADF